MHNGEDTNRRCLEQKLLPEERQTPAPGPARGFVVSRSLSWPRTCCESAVRQRRRVPCMYPHHERAIARLVAEMRDDPRYLALLVGGSIAKGRERSDSDVDLILVVTAEEFARCQAAGEIQYLNREIAVWPGGYVEGKILDRRFLMEVADHGS